MFGSRLWEKGAAAVFFWLSAVSLCDRLLAVVAAIASSSGSRRPTEPTGPPPPEGGYSDPEHPEYEELHKLLRFPRSGKSGRAQKRAFIRQGVAEGHFALTHPHLLNGVTSFNFCAQSRVTIVEEVLQTYRARFEEAHRLAASALPPRPEPAVPVPPAVIGLAPKAFAKAPPQRPEPVQVSIVLPDTVHFLTFEAAEGRYTRWESQEVHLGAVADIGQVKVLFVDHHQVLDRDHSDTCRQTGRVGVENIEAIEKFRLFALDHERIPFVFVLSFIGSSGRYQACKDIWSRSEGIHHLFDGIICTFEPEGPTGKAAVISRFAERLGDHLSCCLIDDSADILSELEATLATDRATGIHIKLSRKRSLDGRSAYPYAHWLNNGWTKEAVENFIAAE